jgi:predicted O-methyltransferase YrrM
MERKYRQLPIRVIFRALDVIAVPAVYMAAQLLKFVRRCGLLRLPASRRVLLHVGVLPIRDHYYEPLFDGRNLLRPLNAVRSLPGIEWNIDGQLALLAQFQFNDELLKLPVENQGGHSYYFNNTAFGPGDGEYLYNMIRLKKPRRIVEVGSGFSTLMAIEAINANRVEDARYHCDHTCIEPYEMPWLEKTPVQVLRRRVETVDTSIFTGLEENDILFIDSSHVIRPQGDVLFEYLEILPTLRSGVIVHIHDIFSPRDYPASWLIQEIRLWNEQYLLESFLTHNCSWEIIGAVNHLHRDHFLALSAKCPRLKPDRNPGSFYIQRVR